MSANIRVVQLSDTHFMEEGGSPEGGFAYDTGEAFDAVIDHMDSDAKTDLVVVTGDIADHGKPEQYRRAAEAFQQFRFPVNVCPGNHDHDASFTAGMGRPTIGTSRVIESSSWCFLFVDSNAGVMVEDDTGRHIDPDDRLHRLHRNGALGHREASWIREMCAATLAEHVFVWLHHPPSAPIPMVEDAAYASEWASLLDDLPMIRGFGAGHTHIPDAYELDGRSVFVAPALKHNFDLHAETWLPPGYRTYDFAPDGQITSELHLVDDERWPRRRLGRALVSLFNAEITGAEFAAIVERRQRTSG